MSNQEEFILKTLVSMDPKSNLRTSSTSISRPLLNEITRLFFSLLKLRVHPFIFNDFTDDMFPSLKILELCSTSPSLDSMRGDELIFLK